MGVSQGFLMATHSRRDRTHRSTSRACRDAEEHHSPCCCGMIPGTVWFTRVCSAATAFTPPERTSQISAPTVGVLIHTEVRLLHLVTSVTSLGSSQPNRARRYFRFAVGVSVLSSSVLACVVFFARHLWVTWFTDDTDIAETLRHLAVPMCAILVLDSMHGRPHAERMK
eukprot:PhM_4_TR17068/c0_g2_i4/m.30840